MSSPLAAWPWDQDHHITWLLWQSDSQAPVLLNSALRKHCVYIKETCRTRSLCATFILGIILFLFCKSCKLFHYEDLIFVFHIITKFFTHIEKYLGLFSLSMIDFRNTASHFPAFPRNSIVTPVIFHIKTVVLLFKLWHSHCLWVRLGYTLCVSRRNLFIWKNDFLLIWSLHT